MCICLRRRERRAFYVAAQLFFWGNSMLKIRRKKLSVAVVNALNAGVVVGLAAPLAYGQQTPPPNVPTAQAQKIEKIEVTGSRIPSPTLTSESPVNVINSQDIKYTGS